MDEQQLQKIANDVATELPGVSFEHRENPNWETYKVGGKIFMMMTDLPGHSVVTVKADPAEATVLRERYEEISAGYHTDKKHWVPASAGPGIDASLVTELVTNSYGLVVEKLPKSARPTAAAE